MLPIIGGLILIIGAYFVYKGDIFKSVFTYLIADGVWMMMAINAGNFIGAALITIGASLGILAFLKMNSGEFRKTIKKN